MRAAETVVNRATPAIAFVGTCVHTDEAVPAELAAGLERDGRAADAVALVAREHPATNPAVRAPVDAGTPVICLNTDLPGSGRTAHVGHDPTPSSRRLLEIVRKSSRGRFGCRDP